MKKERKVYRNIAIACKSKDLLEEIAKIYEKKHKGIDFNRGNFVSALIEEAYEKMKEE